MTNVADTGPGGPSIRPTREQLQRLSRREQWSFRLSDWVNSHFLIKKTAQLYLRTIGAGWIYYGTRNLVHLIGLENIRDLRPERGLLLASNHRSFFDQGVLSCWLFRKTPRLMDRIYFPVRSEFVYDSPLGVLFNLFLSACSMYPPIFRDPRKRDFNRYSLRRICQLLQQPGCVVGVHPEGTRNKGSDPYKLLRAQHGIGMLILHACPTVVPIFINGISNNLASLLKGNFDRTGDPIIIVFGKPLDLTGFGKKSSLRAQKQVADHVLAEIAKLGRVEQKYRQQLPLGGSKGGPHVIEQAAAD